MLVQDALEKNPPKMSSIQNTKTISRLKIKKFGQSECWFEDWHKKLEHQITFFVGTHCLVTSMKRGCSE